MPYTFTGSFDTAGKTMMGLHPKDIHGVAPDIGAGPLAVGANCGVGASDILQSLLDMTGANPEAVVIVTPGPRPTLEVIVDRIGPLRNKTADESGAQESSRRPRRRGN